MYVVIIGLAIGMIVLVVLARSVPARWSRALLVVTGATLLVATAVAVIRSPGSAPSTGRRSAIVTASDTAPATSVDDAWRLGASGAQVADVQALEWDTHVAMRGFASVDAARGAGFEVVDDHLLVDRDQLDDGRYLDPRRPEGLLVETRDGVGVIVGALFQMDDGMSIRDVPRLGGPLLPWREHGGVCLVDGIAVPPTEGGDRCGSGAAAQSPPSIRVYVDPQSDGDVERTAERCGTFVFTDLPLDGSVPGCV